MGGGLFLLQSGSRGRHGKTLAPALAARGKDFASAFRLHARAKSVRAFSFQSFRLISSFHQRLSNLELQCSATTQKLRVINPFVKY